MDLNSNHIQPLLLKVSQSLEMKLFIIMNPTFLANAGDCFSAGSRTNRIDLIGQFGHVTCFDQ